MPGPAAILRECHRLRRLAKDLQAEVERLPRQLKILQAKAARQEELQKEAQEALKKLKVTSREKEGLFKQTQELIAKHELQLKVASTTKEYEALKSELAHERKRSQDLEEEVLGIEMEIEERTGKLPDFEQAVRQARQECADFDKSAATRKADLSGELQRAQAQLREVEATLAEDVKATYERNVTARGEDALAAAVNHNCQACYTAITAQSYHELQQGRLVLCKNCGRILYVPE